MLTEFQKMLVTRCINRWGKTAQLIIAIEEMSELTKEITKNIRGKENYNEILEELTDCYIMLENIRQIFNISDVEINIEADKKLERVNQ